MTDHGPRPTKSPSGSLPCSIACPILSLVVSRELGPTGDLFPPVSVILDGSRPRTCSPFPTIFLYAPFLASLMLMARGWYGPQNNLFHLLISHLPFLFLILFFLLASCGRSSNSEQPHHWVMPWALKTRRSRKKLLERGV